MKSGADSMWCSVLRSSKSSQGNEVTERVLAMMEASNQLCLNFVNGLALGVKVLKTVTLL